MIGIGWLICYPVVLGLPLACVGVILRMCESSWEKPRGSMGSTWILAAAGLLCLPAVVYLSMCVHYSWVH
jgi:hypothetical protein